MARPVNQNNPFEVWYHERFGYPPECGHGKEAREVWNAALSYKHPSLLAIDLDSGIAVTESGVYQPTPHTEDNCCHPSEELISSTQGFVCKLCGQIV